MYKVKKALLHGLLIAGMAVLPLSAFGVEVKPAVDNDDRAPAVEKTNARFRFGVYYGRPYYYRPYYYYYPYRPYYYRHYYSPYRYRGW